MDVPICPMVNVARERLRLSPSKLPSALNGLTRRLGQPGSRVGGVKILHMPQGLSSKMCTMNIALCTLHNEHYTMQIVLYILHYTHCTMHIALYTLHYEHCTMHIILCTLHCALCKLYNTHCTMHISLSTLYFAH